jgi:hemolysin activation/secretion protein
MTEVMPSVTAVRLSRQLIGATRISHCWAFPSIKGDPPAWGLPTVLRALLYAAEPVDIPVRPSERPLESPELLPDKAAEGFVLPPVPQVPPESPATGTTLDVSAIALEGNRAIPTEELLAIARPFVGLKLTSAEIEELRHQIARHYIGMEHINSGVTLPEDSYRCGRLTFHIVEGRLEAVRPNGMEWLRESYIRGRLSHGEESLNVNVRQERFQRLLTDPLFAKLSSRLLPWITPGQATLDADVTRARAYQLGVFANKYRPSSIRAESFGASGWVRNLTGSGDLLDDTYQDGEGSGRYGFGWTVPLGPYGTQLHNRTNWG